jgi:hypothetical protein
MPVNSIQTRFWYQAAGDDFVTRTSDFNMIPGDIMVTSALTLIIDGAAEAAGIMSASSVQAGQENFGNSYWQWRSSLFRQGLRTLTVAIATSPHRTAQGLFTLFVF